MFIDENYLAKFTIDYFYFLKFRGRVYNKKDNRGLSSHLPILIYYIPMRRYNITSIIIYYIDKDSDFHLYYNTVLPFYKF